MLKFFNNRSWLELDYWALDLETTGLRPRQHAICAIGMVPVRQGTIRWGERIEKLVHQPRAQASQAQSIAIHHILPDEIAQASPLSVVYSEVLQRTRGHGLIVHHQGLDCAFLRAAAQHTQQPVLNLPVVDTLVLLQRLNKRLAWLGTPPLPYGLAAARSALGLPPYPAHDALSDALACAELFLVVRHRLNFTKVRQLL